ncbi:hypothetical protein JCM10213v2_008342 [Rhodosporidiobolus nylandii]
MSRRWSAQRSNRFAAAVLLPLVGLTYIAYRLSSGNGEMDNLPYSFDAKELAGEVASAGRGGIVVTGGQATEKLLDSLLRVPEEEIGRIAICASVHNEGRFITEWLLYNRAIGVDRFYLYDTGSDDNTLEVLQPWIETGTVKLHRFNHEQGGHFQLNSLETCSRTYASQTDWLLDADVDEFYVIPHSLTSYSRSRPLLPQEMPEAPLYKLLSGNWLYNTADAIAVSRVTWKNSGIQQLPEEASVLVYQNLRDIYHGIRYDKLEFTKSIVHTKRRSGWIIPGAHYVKHPSLARDDAKIITADGQPVELDPLVPSRATPKEQGTLYKGRFAGRAFEPIVMAHYVERDLENCYAKLRRASKVRKGGWRSKAGPEGCKSYELYQPNDDWVPLHEKDSFYGGAVKDLTMADSWYGQHLPSLIHASLARAHTLSAPAKGKEAALPFQPTYTDPHSDLVEEWRVNGFDLVWGEKPDEAKERKKAAQEDAGEAEQGR